MNAGPVSGSEPDLLRWRSLSPPDAIKQLLDRVFIESTSMEGWYERHQARASNWSKRIRAAAIILGVLGGLCPIVAGVRGNLISMELANAVGQLGYVFIAVAAGLIAFDNYFGISAEWMRCTTALNQIRRLRSDLQFDWAALLLKLPESPTAVDIEPFLTRARGASAAFSDVLASETEEWRRNFEKSFGEIETAFKLDQTRGSSARGVPPTAGGRGVQAGKATNTEVRRR
jgi:hypothetical protein